MTKVLVSFDDALLGRIDRAARARGLTRSAYLALLASRGLGPGRSPIVRAALHKLDDLFADSLAGDSTAEIREARDAR